MDYCFINCMCKFLNHTYIGHSYRNSSVLLFFYKQEGSNVFDKYRDYFDKKEKEIEEKTNLINKKIFDETACSEKGIKF